MADSEKWRALTVQQEAFAAGVAQGLSQSDAYRRAYPKSVAWKDSAVWETASRMSKRPNVAARVQELLGRAMAANHITVERVMREIARIGFCDVRKLMDTDGKLKPIHELDDDTAAAIAGLDVVRVRGDAGGEGEGEVLKIKLADKNSALEKLGRHLGAFERDNRQQAGLTFDAAKFFADLLRNNQQGGA